MGEEDKRSNFSACFSNLFPYGMLRMSLTCIGLSQRWKWRQQPLKQAGYILKIDALTPNFERNFTVLIAIQTVIIENIDQLQTTLNIY